MRTGGRGSQWRAREMRLCGALFILLRDHGHLPGKKMSILSGRIFFFELKALGTERVKEQRGMNSHEETAPHAEAMFGACGER